MRPRGALLLVLLAACQADRIITEDLPAVTFDAHAWRGSTLQFVSSAFNSSDSFRILLGGAAMALQRLDSLTLVATLPDTAGTFDVAVETGGRLHLIGPVTLHGGILANRLAPMPDATAMAWPYGAGTFLAGVGGRLTRFDVFSGALTPTFADSLYSGWCGWGPWPAGRDAVVLAGPVPGRSRGGNDYCRARVVGSGGAVVDSFPLYDKSFWYPTLRLADGSWVVNFSRAGTVLYRRMAGGGFQPSSAGALSEVWRMAASPDGMCAFAAAGRSDSGGLPILCGDRLDAQVVVPNVPYSWAAAFSESGDTLAVTRYESDSLFLVASLTGNVLAAVPATGFYTDLAFDSGHPWLYAASGESGGVGLSVTVFDLRTMRVAAVLHAGSQASGLIYPEVYLSVDIWHRRLNALLSSDNHTGSSGAGFSFDLMP